MSTFFWMILSYIARALLSLRYRLEIKEADFSRLNRREGILFMPNHPAHMDPLILFLLLWPKFRMRPLVVEYIFNLPLLQPFNKLVKAIPVPNFETGVNELKVKRAEKSIREIAEGLKRGENFILYPAGRLKSTGKELLGGASAAHEILKECPKANVVLIRTTGLWGSSFSRALLGRSPELPKTLLHGGKILLKNGIFFALRRKVQIEMESNPEDMPRNGVSRIDLNRYLENWYNRYPDDCGKFRDTEPLALISYSRRRNEFPEVFKSKKRKNGGSGGSVSDETKRKIYNEIKRILDNPSLVITPEMSPSFDLGMDSLNAAEFISYLTKNFDVGELYPEDLETVGAILEIAEGGKGARTTHRLPVDFTWPEETLRPLPMVASGSTVAEVFLNSCRRMDGYVACGDDLLGVLSYRTVKKKALVLAQYFKRWEEPRIGVMLPASAGAYIVILALQLAGKTPVMLNWTLGSRYLEEMMQLSGSKRIVSSWKFLDRLAGVQFGSCLDRFVLLEEIRKELTLGMKLRGVLLSKSSTSCALKAMKIHNIDENSPCVILFTSGTEAAPKGVPLSHKNLVVNQRAAMQCMDIDEKDVVYGILPPFHSFGFSVAGLFPLLAGIKLAFYPDPTDSFALAEGVQRWKVTLFCGAPSFLKGLFYAAKPEQLQGVRLFISGAEKAPGELFERVKQLNTGAKLIEGYGITECAPILTINDPRVPPKGAGRPLPGIEMVTIHPETLELLPQGGDGEICVRGPNVFAGYLGNPRTPFITIDGLQWYRTGDLGHLDPDGRLILSGRLKRFTKLGGEMISLGAVEEVMAKSLLESGKISPDIPSIAIIADEREEGKPRLILFTTLPIEKEEANAILQKGGFSNLIKISAVKQVDEIPIMGAGKTDYRTLQGLC